MKKSNFILYTIFILIISILTVIAISADILTYKVTTLYPNKARLSANQDLFLFSLNLSGSTHSSVEIKSLTYTLMYDPLINASSLQSVRMYHKSATNETLVAFGTYIGGAKISFVMNSTININRGVTENFLIRANISHKNGTGIPDKLSFALKTTDVFIVPSTSVTITNEGNPTGNFTYTNYIWDNQLTVTNLRQLIQNTPGPLQRNQSYGVFGFSIDSPTYATTGNGFFISKIIMYYPAYAGNDYNDIEEVKLYLDNGDRIYNTADDSLISTHNPNSTTLEFNLSTALYVNSSSPQIIWTTVKIAPNAKTNNNLILRLDVTNTSLEWSSYTWSPQGTYLHSWTNTITDTVPPGNVTEPTIVVGKDKIFLKWKNPSDKDIKFIRLIYQTVASYPPNPFLGIITDIDVSNMIGKETNFLWTGLASGMAHNFKIFTFDSASNYQAAGVPSLSATPLSTTSTPSSPGNVEIVPREKYISFKWDASSDPKHHHYLIKAHVEYQGTSYYTNSSPIYTTSLELDKNILGINYYSSFTNYFSVVSVDIDGELSNNDFTNTTSIDEIYKIAVRTTYNPITQKTALVYRNIFRPANNEYARVIVNIDNRSNVSIKIYSLSGEHVRTLANRTLDPGTHEFNWNGKDLRSTTVHPGVYFVHIKFDDFNEVKKVVVRR